MLRDLWILLPLALLPACGGGRSNPPGLTARGGSLEADGASVPAVVVVARAVPEVGHVSVGDVAEVDGRLRISGNRVRQVNLPLVADPGAFDAVRLDLRSSAPEKIIVGLVRGDAVLDGPPNRTVEADPGEPVLLDFPPEVLEGEPISGLRIAFLAEAEWNELGAVELVRRTPLGHLDGAGSAQRPGVTLGRETRPATAIVAGATGEVRVGVPDGHRLRLAVGVPGNQPLGEGRLQGGGPSALRDLDLARLAPNRWHPVVTFDADATFDLSLEGAPAGAAVVLGWELVRVVAEPRRVLLITSDTHRADHLGRAGEGVEVRTPALDQLVARGTLFSDGWATTHITNPSHVALMTGVHPRDHGILDNRTPLLDVAPTLAERFRDAGFRTFAATSASHLAPERAGLQQGFGRYAAPRADESEGFDAPGRVLGWLDDVAPDESVFVWLHLFDAHAPYRPPAEAFAGYWPADRDPRAADLPRPPRVPGWATGVRDLDYLAAQYRGEVTRVDERLAPVLAHPALAQAVIAFTADHGEHLGVTDGWFDHRHLDRATLRVPLVLAGPGVPAGERVVEPVQTLDLGGTLLELAGVARGAFPGIDLMADGARPREALFGLARNGEAASVVVDGWLGVLHLCEEGVRPGDLSRRRHQFELFELATDPEAATDVAEAEVDRARDLHARIRGWLGAARPKPWAGSTQGSAALDQELAAMGYSGGEEVEAYDPDCRCDECRRWR